MAEPGGRLIIACGLPGAGKSTVARRLAEQLGAAVELHYLDTPLDELFRRISTRNAESPPITYDQLQSWSAAFQRPTSAELALCDPPTEVIAQ